MPKTAGLTLSQNLKKIPPAVRPTVRAARRVVMATAPEPVEIPYQSHAPRSPSTMWKLVRYTVDGTNVIGVGAFSSHSTLFFYRGRELDDRSGLLQGSGKDLRFITLRTPADAQRLAVKQMVSKAFKLGAGRAIDTGGPARSAGSLAPTAMASTSDG